jgi:hypothetical protein
VPYVTTPAKLNVSPVLTQRGYLIYPVPDVGALDG